MTLTPQELMHITQCAYQLLTAMGEHVEENDGLRRDDPTNPVIFMITPDGIAVTRLAAFIRKYLERANAASS
jgi:hypothetical protein